MHVDPKEELKKSRPGIFGVGVILLMVAIALFAPFLSQYDPAGQTASEFEAPSLTHWLGTNHVGQDI
ncbi:MAG: ABC transporter permease, partial [Dehalococcoidia bacterium]